MFRRDGKDDESLLFPLKENLRSFDDDRTNSQELQDEFIFEMFIYTINKMHFLWHCKRPMFGHYHAC